MMSESKKRTKRESPLSRYHPKGIKKVGSGYRVIEHEGANDAWVSPDQDPATYLTTDRMAKRVGVDRSTVHRWCRVWFGELPEGRLGHRGGYRIPLKYERVGRLWKQTHDPLVRRVGLEVLLEDGRDFLVVVGKQASTHYDVGQAVERAESVLGVAARKYIPVHIYYVGEVNHA